MATRNPYEEDARAAKIERIVAAIDRASDGLSNADVYEWAKTLTEDGWAMVAGVARVHMPSDVTRKQVLGLLERRARIASMRSA